MSAQETIPLLADAPSRRRVALIDLEEMAEWLVKRLQEKHPNATPAAILGWLRGCMAANYMWFVRTENAVALAEITRQPLEDQPIAVEHFVLAREGFSDEAATLYPAMASWAANQNASALHFERYTDVSRPQFKAQCGGFYTKSLPFLRLGRLD